MALVFSQPPLRGLELGPVRMAKPCRVCRQGLPCMSCAVEALALREELAALRETAGCDEVAVLHEELAGLRAELLRLADENRRLQSTPKARRCSSIIREATRLRQICRHQIGHGRHVLALNKKQRHAPPSTQQSITRPLIARFKGPCRQRGAQLLGGFPTRCRCLWHSARR